MNFSELNLHPSVADALARRGYDTATPVQAAVLRPEAAGRDLLVSSQTGSGKTIAFGAVLADALLAPGAARSAGARVNPLALVIVPTRELAVQVRDELGWLLRESKLRLASFTGGTAVSGDLRALQKGLDIAIGTPGRLVDLLKRQRLELSDIRVVVLDEADEMLDLGFREDLQTLLQAAPEARRTLMLSATLPPEIQALARRFQREALRIDPRQEGGRTAAAGHGDITYVAHLIAAADRLAVVVNLLRAAGEGRAIVFCTTREGVSRLHGALLTRGFAATAISGERAQAERDRALAQVRKGDARVLVATNVAARGLHLPDVDLIIHADLPLNAESLTHRSGRTGRAGRKGTAVVLASLTERRKAERLLMSAGVPVVWTAPPSAESITAAARDRLAEELLREVGEEPGAGAGAGPDDPAAEEMVARMETLLPAREIARRLLLRELVKLPVGERVQLVPVPGPERRDRFAPVSVAGPGAGLGGGAGAGFGSDRGGGRRPGREDFAREGVLFRLNIGAQDNADVRWLLPLICRRGGVISKDVGAIRIGPRETVFEISGDAAADFALSAAERDPRAPQVHIEVHTEPARPTTQPAQLGTVVVEPLSPSPADRRPAVKNRDQAKKHKRMTAPTVDNLESKTARPVAKVPAAAPAAATAVKSPASIFQTRFPVEPPPGVISPARPDEEAPPPRSPRQALAGERGERPAPQAPVIEMKRAPHLGHGPGRPSSGRPSTMAPRTRDADRPRTDGTNLIKRSFKSPQPHPAGLRESSSPSHASSPGRGAPGPRPAHHPHEHAHAHAHPEARPTRPPFWKEGARRRPGPPSRPGASEAPTAKPPRR